MYNDAQLYAGQHNLNRLGLVPYLELYGKPLEVIIAFLTRRRVELTRRQVELTYHQVEMTLHRKMLLYFNVKFDASSS